MWHKTWNGYYYRRADTAVQIKQSISTSIFAQTVQIGNQFLTDIIIVRHADAAAAAGCHQRWWPTAVLPADAIPTECCRCCCSVSGQSSAERLREIQARSVDWTRSHAHPRRLVQFRFQHRRHAVRTKCRIHLSLGFVGHGFWTGTFVSVVTTQLG